MTSDDRGLRCPDPSCGCAGAGPFPTAAGQPALVDFERSILTRDALERTVTAGDGGHGVVATMGRRLFAPFNQVAARHATRMIDALATGARSRVLVVGGGTVGNGARALYEAPGIEVVAFDVYPSRWTQFVADAHQIPLSDASVDAVWIQAVLEHVLEPAVVVAELVRVLAPGGWVYAETPFLQAVHEGPADFTRFTESGHRWLFRDFERLGSGSVAGPGLSLAWAIDHLARGLTRSKMVGRLVSLPFAWLPWLDRLIPEPYASDAASCVYFFGRKSNAPLPAADIVGQYRGAQRPPARRPG